MTPEADVTDDLVTVSKPDLVTLALAELGGAQHAVDTEDIAIKARELNPGAFAWRRYPEHINLELVRVALVDATRASYVQGRGRGGWVLTDLGVDWSQANRSRLLGALGRTSGSGAARVKQPETMHRERERMRLARTDAWLKWRDNLAVTPQEAAAVFRVDQYTLDTHRLTKVRSLRNLFYGDADLQQFLDAMSLLVSTSPGTEAGSNE